MQVKDQLNDQMANLLVHYRDDQDWQNLIDWVQLDWVSRVNALVD
jgi:hypothetical protein